jgi:succinyl-CoA synthetase beta subunit
VSYSGHRCLEHDWPPEALLCDYGIPVAESATADSTKAALAAAQRLGWPIVLKTAVPGVAHKSDVGGVVTGLTSAAALERACDELIERLGSPVLVQAMAPAGVELALGIVRDAQFGPLVMVAIGGVLVEILRDRAFGLPPLDAPRAERLLNGLTARRLLAGVRGAAPADTAAVIDTMVRLSVLAADLGDLIDGLDINPLIAGPDGCVAVDALVVPRGDQGSETNGA